MSVPITAKTAPRYLVGKTIASVEVEPTWDSNGDKVHDVKWITFTDGSYITLNASECHTEIAVTAERHKEGR